MKTFSTATPVPRPPRRSGAVDAVPAAQAVSGARKRRAATGLSKRRTGAEQAGSLPAFSPANKGAAVDSQIVSTARRQPTGLTWSEATIQRQVFNILKLRGVKGLIFWHAANEEANARRRLWKHHQGVVAGIPDVQLFYRSRLYCLELKKLGGKATEQQYEMMDRFREQGAETGIAYGYFDAIEHLERWQLLIGRTI